MKNCKILELFFFPIVIAFSISGCANGSKKQSVWQPNILWITCEDISPHLGCYGDEYAYTPTLDSLAKSGIIFSNAFSAASVCTPARSSIITGVYASSMGTQHLRAEMTLSKNLKCFPEYLRIDGYYCTNNSKEDYNFETPVAVWDESSKEAHWRNRKPGQSFFSVFNYTLTHQSQTRYGERELLARNAKLPEEARHRWEDAPVPSYYPDTRVVKANIAALHTQITLLDYEVKNLLSELMEDGLEEKTIIFFFSDHGDGLPRHKRWLHDTGTKVPFMVYIPEKYRSLSSFQNNTVVSDLVSFEDLAPTVLSLAGIPIPEYMNGNVFLNKDEYQKREAIFTIRDRVDENYLFSRGVRESKFHYIRNFFPLLPRMPFSGYSEITPIRKEIRRLNNDGKLNGRSAWLVQETTPFEELYDIETDPEEMNNLATDPAYAKELARMQKHLKKWMIESKDLSLIPEPEMIRQSGELSSYDVFSSKSSLFFEEAFNAAEKVGKVQDVNELIQDTKSRSVITQFWSLVALMYLQNNGVEIPVPELEPQLNNSSEIIRIKTAELILWEGKNAKANKTITDCLNQDDSATKMVAVSSLFRLFQKNKIDALAYKALLMDSNFKKTANYSTYIENMVQQMYSR